MQRTSYGSGKLGWGTGIAGNDPPKIPKFLKLCPKLARTMRRYQDSRLKDERKQAEFLRYCGTPDPEDFHIQRAAQFLSKVNDLPFSHKQKPSAVRIGPANIGGKHFVPGSAKDGSGMVWLRLFADYDGDKCLIFPFATASSPRGSVHYNFKRMEAHRAMCLHVHKLPTDEGKTMALHKCGNGHLGCVNPKHLYWGDQSDNNADARRHMVEGKVAA